jgi:type I restriction enzyme M protein
MKNFEAFKEHGDVIWNIANVLRGPYQPPQYRRVMIPLTVLRSLDCVLEESKDKVVAEHKRLKAERKADGKAKYDADTIEKMINRKFTLTFHNTSDFTFRKLLGDPDKLAPNLVNFMSGFSARARKIIEKFNFTDEIEKLEEANRLFEVIKEVAAVDLHPDTIPNIAMGYVFEDLVRRFNEQANEEAGDHFTPRDVIKLMVHLLFTYDDIVYKEGRSSRFTTPPAAPAVCCRNRRSSSSIPTPV